MVLFYFFLVISIFLWYAVLATQTEYYISDKVCIFMLFWQKYMLVFAYFV